MNRTKPPRRPFSRRTFLAACLLLLSRSRPPASSVSQPIIDIHQHTDFGGRTDSRLIAHQTALGVTRTVLLPAGRYGGLDARCGGNESTLRLARELPDRFVTFANEAADLADAPQVIGKYLQLGAIGIGEQKFRVKSHSKQLERIAAVAREFEVPILMHFEFGRYNTGFKHFHRLLDKFPTVNFIGHAQTWWGNIDARHRQTDMFPGGRVTPGGLTDRLLGDYPNLYADLSGRPGLNALIRDEDHARHFLARHQDRVLFGSDCGDSLGAGPACHGAQILKAIHRLAPSPSLQQKILHHNARRLLKL